VAAAAAIDAIKGFPKSCRAYGSAEKLTVVFEAMVFGAVARSRTLLTMIQ